MPSNPRDPAEQGAGAPERIASEIEAFYSNFDSDLGKRDPRRDVLFLLAQLAQVQAERDEAEKRADKAECIIAIERAYLAKIQPCPDCRDKLVAGRCERCARQKAEAERDALSARLARVTAEQREVLAALAHEQWTGWMRYLFSRCEPCAGGVKIPAAWVERWQRQMDTPYAKLSEREQESDRKEADRVLAALSPSPAPSQPADQAEDPRIAERTRQVMREINACTPGATLAEVPTLFAFGPIYRALAEASKAARDQLASVLAQVQVLPAKLRQSATQERTDSDRAYRVQDVERFLRLSGNAEAYDMAADELDAALASVSLPAETAKEAICRQCGHIADIADRYDPPQSEADPKDAQIKVLMEALMITREACKEAQDVMSGAGFGTYELRAAMAKADAALASAPSGPEQEQT